MFILLISPLIPFPPSLTPLPLNGPLLRRKSSKKENSHITDSYLANQRLPPKMYVYGGARPWGWGGGELGTTTFFRSCDFIFNIFLIFSKISQSIPNLPVILYLMKFSLARTFVVELHLDDVLEVLLEVGSNFFSHKTCR